MKELVSVVIPAFNMVQYVERSVESALRQTYSELEVIVVNDGSTDHTSDILSKIARREKRVRLLEQENAGVAAARNKGIGVSAGGFIAPLDADDLWHPEKIQRQISRFKECSQDVAVVYCAFALIDLSDKVIPTRFTPDPFDFEGKILPALVWRNFGPASIPLIRREPLLAVNGYDPSLRRRGGEGCEDKDLYIRLSERWKFSVVPEMLVGHRVRPDSMSRNVRSMKRSHQLVIKAVRRRHPNLPPAIMRWSNARVNITYALRSARKSQLPLAIRFFCGAMAEDPAWVLFQGWRAARELVKLLTRPSFKKERAQFPEFDTSIPCVLPGGVLAKRLEYIWSLCREMDAGSGVTNPSGASPSEMHYWLSGSPLP